MIQRFTAYRRNLSELVEAGKTQHSPSQYNPGDVPQFEGVVFPDGTTVIKWLTAAKSISIFSCLKEMLIIHGHPEYGTDFVWLDGPMPYQWEEQLVEYAEKMQAAHHAAGYTDVLLQFERNRDETLKRLVVKNLDESIHHVVHPPGE